MTQTTYTLECTNTFGSSGVASWTVGVNVYSLGAEGSPASINLRIATTTSPIKIKVNRYGTFTGDVILTLGAMPIAKMTVDMKDVVFNGDNRADTITSAESTAGEGTILTADLSKLTPKGTYTVVVTGTASGPAGPIVTTVNADFEVKDAFTIPGYTHD
jgi:hypothetical protein